MQEGTPDGQNEAAIPPEPTASIPASERERPVLPFVEPPAPRKDTSSGEVAILIGTCDRLDQLQEAIRSVRATVRLAWTVYAIDAGSSDGTIEWLHAEASEDPRVRPFFERERTGQARALNEVLPLIAEQFVCWISDDNVLVGDGVDRGVEALRSDEQLGMVGLKVRDVKGPFVDDPYIGGLTSTGILNVNQGLLRTSLLRALNGFDEDFGSYGIDADLTTRILLAGFDVAYTRAVAIRHSRNWPERGSPAAERLEEINREYRRLYAAKHAASFGLAPAWFAGRMVWRAMRALLAARSAATPILGRPLRDWRNILAGRFIRLNDELRSRNSVLHLRQRSPRP